MNRYIQHQLLIEVCATEAMAEVVSKKIASDAPVNRHSIRSSAKMWLNDMPAPLRDGENTVAASEALTTARIACLKAAAKMAAPDASMSSVIEVASSQFLRDYQPLMQKLANAKYLYDTPIVLLGGPQTNVFPAPAPRQSRPLLQSLSEMDDGMVMPPSPVVQMQNDSTHLLPHSIFTSDQAGFLMRHMQASQMSSENVGIAASVAHKFANSMSPEAAPLTIDDIQFLSDQYRTVTGPDAFHVGTALNNAFTLFPAEYQKIDI